MIMRQPSPNLDIPLDGCKWLGRINGLLSPILIVWDILGLFHLLVNEDILGILGL